MKKIRQIKEESISKSLVYSLTKETDIWHFVGMIEMDQNMFRKYDKMIINDFVRLNIREIVYAN